MTKTPANNILGAQMFAFQHPGHGPRILQLGSDVDEDSVNSLITSILYWNQEDSEKEQQILNYNRKPIQLYISSFGGSIYAGLSLVNVIRTSKTPILSFCIGHAMSMAFIIMISCHRRYGYKNSTFMYHEISCMQHGKLHDIKENVKIMDKLQKVLDEIVIGHTKIDKKKLTEINNKKTDWYMSSVEAKKFCAIDEIIN